MGPNDDGQPELAHGQPFEKLLGKKTETPSGALRAGAETR
jgi:hypothetical protein